MAGPMMGQNQFVQYGADPGAYLIKGMESGNAQRKTTADIAHQERNDEMTNQYKNTIMDEHRQKTDQQARANDPKRLRNMALGLWALGVDDTKQFDQAKQLIYNDLPEEDKAQLGDPDKWTKADIARTLGNSMMGGEFNTLERFAQNYFSSRLMAKNKLDVADKKNSGKSSINDPKVMSAWFQLSKTLDPEQRTEGMKLFTQKINEGSDVMEATEYVSSLADENKKSYEESSSAAEDFNAQNKGILGFGKKTMPMPKRPSLMDTASRMGETMGSKQIDADTARQFLQEAGGDKAKARAIAKQRGYAF
jgi:hypothetical protein